MPRRGASQCLQSMCDQLAYRRVWQKVHAKHRDFVTRTAREGPPADSGATTGSHKSLKDYGGPLLIPLRAVSPANQDVLARHHCIGQGSAIGQPADQVS